MKARHWFSVLFVAFALAASCTNDFDQFSVSGADDDGDGTNGGASGGTSGTGGAALGGTAGSGGTLVPGTGGAGRGGTGPVGGSAGVSGTTGEAGAAGGGGCTTDEKECDGTCVPLTDPATGCGSVDTCEPCLLDNATAACAGDECRIGRCDGDFGDCNARAADGCEQTLDDAILHCGACDRACATQGVASVECVGGRCVSSCAAGSANCTIPATGADDGCETSTASDAENCGGCGNDCTAQGLGVCGNGLCACDQNQCGNGSGVACSGGLCSCDATLCRPGEVCRQSGGNRLCGCNGGDACAADQVCCQTPAGCTDVQTSPTSCGACGRACTPGFACSAGECACDGDEDCDAGTPEVATGAGGEGGGPATGPACVSGRCVCGTTTCAEGQRCLDGGGCG